LKSPDFRHWPIKAYLQYVRLRRAMTLGVRAAVFDADQRVFLVRHSYVPGWYLPGGGVEAGETIEEALVRELMEEGGFRLDRPADLFGVYLNRSLSSRDHVALFVTSVWTQVRVPKVPNAEILECGFFPSGALPANTTDATHRRLAEIGGAPRSPDW
jgi:8-oxo-dGTP pyrophosphatase MutT (NUDIX family)